MEWKIIILKIIDTSISFYLYFIPKSKFLFRHLKRSIQNFHMKHVSVPADKTTNSIVVVWYLYYVDTLKR